MSWFIAKRLAQAKDYEVKREARAIMTALKHFAPDQRGHYSMETLARQLSEKGVMERVTAQLDFLATNLSRLKDHDKVRALGLFVEIAKIVSGTKVKLTVDALKDMPNEQLDVEINRLRQQVAAGMPPEN